MAIPGRLVNIPKWSKGVQNCLKWPNIDFFLPFGTPLGRREPFGLFQTKNDFLLKSTSAKPYFVHYIFSLIILPRLVIDLEWIVDGRPPPSR